MIGVVDCDTQIYAQIDNLIPVNKYMLNILKSDEYYRYKINHLFPVLLIPNTIKTYDFYQNIKNMDIEKLIKYVFNFNDTSIYKWLLLHHSNEYWNVFQSKRTLMLLDIFHDENKIDLINQLLKLYLTHHDIICHNNNVPNIKLNIKVWVKMVPHNDIIQKCMDKYGIKL